MKDHPFLIFMVIVAIIAFAAYYVFHDDAPEKPTKDDLRGQELKKRIEINDSVVRQDDQKSDSLTQYRNEKRIAHTKEKPSFRTIDADSSTKLLAKSFIEYATSKDSF